jgi:hypothetical protein
MYCIGSDTGINCYLLSITFTLQNGILVRFAFKRTSGRHVHALGKSLYSNNNNNSDNKKRTFQYM